MHNKSVLTYLMQTPLLKFQACMILSRKCNEKTVYLVGERHSREGLCQDEGDGVFSKWLSEADHRKAA